MESERANRPAPVLVWMHGRTVNKELDPGRYLRLARAGIASCALDLPAHGERADSARQGAEATLGVVAQMVDELDAVVADLAGRPEFAGQPLAVGGMSAGGMAALVRLTRPHGFSAALIESSTGDLRGQARRTRFAPDLSAELDPMTHLGQWRNIPILGIHSQRDAWVPVEGQRAFFAAIRARSPHPERVVLHEFPETGAPFEHSGFGRVAGVAKELGTEFLSHALMNPPPAAVFSK